MWWPIDLSPSEHIAIASIYLAFWTSLKWEMVGSECYSDSGASFSYFHTHTHAHIKKISKCSFSYLTFHPHKFYFRSLWKEILKNQSEDFVFQHQMFVPFSPFLLADCVFSIFFRLPNRWHFDTVEVILPPVALACTWWQLTSFFAFSFSWK